MNCQELMKTEVESVAGDDTVGKAARLMRDANVGFLPVCDENNRVLGTVTDRDIAIRLVAEDLPASTSVSDVMTGEVISCRPDDDIRRAEELMGRYHKSRIVCLDAQGRLAGVISLSDIVQAEEDQRAARTMREIAEREAPAIH
ncbi:MAG: CBS domain-containing protein [Myxococcales bacterium]|nr:CBS domain-containing protein [Myxococcales bacterium]